ncbi:hypothetical protein [Solirubrobacter pauli]|uniref:ATP-dependent DNA ligase n=1 Tax=Solirubrobacter pauli TaxID=166793 RepID=UPI001FECD336|nr:hypothetical protein [Solirubrobacter pauli]
MRLYSRPGRDCTTEFPEIAAAGRQLGRDVVLDGEIICLDAQGRPDFERIRRRLGLRRSHAVAAVAVSAPVAFVAFDLLALDGRHLCARPYRERRAQLEELLAAAPDAGISAVPSYDAASTDLAAATRDMQLEGIVAKRLDSRYLPGQRSRAWLKHKHSRSEALIVTGWRPATDREPDAVFLARLAPDGTLSYAGQASYGLAAQRGALLRALDAHERRGRSRHGIRSVLPAIGVHVDHHGRVGEGVLRDPVMRRFKVLSTFNAT